MKNYKRRIYLINKPFQLKYVVMVILLIAVYSLFTGYAISVALDSAQKVVECLPDVSPDDLSAIQKQNQNIYTTMIFLLVLNVIVVGVLWILAMHRIAGPIYRLRKNMDELKTGRIPPPIHLRKGDEFKDLIDDFNRMVEQLRSDIGVYSECVSKVMESLASLSADLNKNESVGNDIKERLESLYEEVKKISENRAFKLSEE
jgi:methyl-accepting chemotaxis protein